MDATVYADDIFLLASTRSAMAAMLSVCQRYVENHNIEFFTNVSKNFEQKGVWPLNYKIINSAHIRDIYFFYISELIPPPMAFHLNFFHKGVLIEIKPFLAVANHYLIGSYETAWIKLLGITGMLWTVPVCSGQYPSCMNERRNNED